MIENIGIKISGLIKKLVFRWFVRINSDNVDQSQKHEYNIDKVFVLPPVQSNTHDQITDEIRRLSSRNKKDRMHKIVLGNNIGIVTDTRLTGTTVNIEFAIRNRKASPLIIKGVSGELNGHELNFRGFFKFSDEGKQRVPDLSRRFPYVIASDGADRLEIILENLDKELITKGDLEGKLFVLTDENEVAQEVFTLIVDDRMIKRIGEAKKLSKDQGLPFVFDETIKIK